MIETGSKPELVVPAGNFEKLKTALYFGADAVYLGGEYFNLRVRAGNFSIDELAQAVSYTRERKKKIYLTLNSFLYESQISVLLEYLDAIKHIDFDAVIIADPGVIDLVRNAWEHVRIHLSTQANTLNHCASQFWKRQGISRIVLARELTLAEITSINKNTVCETELFIHGAVCLSYSGRCYLSKYITGRDANLGDCTQNCRWKYALVEETRPGIYLPVSEENNESYILNAQDFCSIRILPDLLRSGVSAFKIEGRMKSVYYIATVTKVYREAIDKYYAKEIVTVQDEWINELEMLSHRPYTYEPYSGDKEALAQDISRCREKGIFLAVVTDCLSNGYIRVSVRNCLRQNDKIDIISPNQIYPVEILDIKTNENVAVSEAHPNQEVVIKLSGTVTAGDILRRVDKGDKA